MALDEENLREPLHHYHPDDVADSHITAQSTAFLGRRRSRKKSDGRAAKTGGNGNRSIRPRWMHTSQRVLEADEGDDDVPASLLVEGHDEDDFPKPPAPPPHHVLDDDDYPEPGPSSPESRDRWRATRAQQPLHSLSPRRSRSRRRPDGGLSGLAAASPKDKAMWRWANVENLDNFLKEVYVYYLGNGLWCILLSRTLNLL
jgi:autophagy-related protein 9